MHLNWAIRLLMGTAFAVAAPVIGLAEAKAQVGQDDVFQLVIAAATAKNPRNSESDIIELRDGRLLLGWTEFYAGNGADDGAARIVGRVSTDSGRSWGDKYTLVENDGTCNVMEVSFLRLNSGDLALFHLQKNVEVGGPQAPDCRVMLRTSQDEGRTGPVNVELGDLPEVLGPVKFLPETATRSWGPGIATGLAWTPVGGELIFIETLRTPGSGRLILTGQLGEVMKESATAALTYIRAHGADLGVDDEKFEHSDIHVHVPAGSIPKDGPSAGVALVVALASLMSGRPARREVAMTGEITLRGDILPVGGIKEKVLAARRAGILEVIIPQANAKDLVDIPRHLQEGMTFREAQIISELLDCALEPAQG